MGQDLEIERALTPGERDAAWQRPYRSEGVGVGQLFLLDLGGTVLLGGLLEQATG